MVYEYKAKVVRVVDGDTIVLEVDLGFNVKFKETFRLLGINTPEVYGVKKDSEEYKKGLLASNFMKETLPEGVEVMIQTKKDAKGKYGRYLCKVFKDTINLNEKLVELGLAERFME